MFGWVNGSWSLSLFEPYAGQATPLHGVKRYLEDNKIKNV